jgi:hypothetical protein
MTEIEYVGTTLNNITERIEIRVAFCFASKLAVRGEIQENKIGKYVIR